LRPAVDAAAVVVVVAAAADSDVLLSWEKAQERERRAIREMGLGGLTESSYLVYPGIWVLSAWMMLVS
jgi:hypothetical protein